MTTAVPYTTAEGSLYELVARGNKDVFFYQDTKDSKYIFDNAYDAHQAYSYEVRRVPPSSAAEFGRTCEFSLDLVGDAMIHPTLVINLPTWLPPQIAATASSSTIQDTSGITYGYTNGIGYFLFESIEFYQDNILIQNFSGDGLWAQQKNQGTFAHSFMTNLLTGQHNGSAQQIARNATPPQLRLQLPLPGTQGATPKGFPQRSLQQHRYRLKLKLRKLEDLVEASDGRVKPQPWGRSDFTQKTSAAGAPQPFTTLDRTQIPPLTLQLETTQLYFPREVQDEMASQPQKVFFRRVRETVYTQNQLDYQGLTAGGTATVSRRLEGRHPTERILWFFRSQADLNSNRLWKLFTGFSQLTLLIAGQTREAPRSPTIWRDLTNLAKEQLDTGDELYTMNWGIGDLVPNRFSEPLSEQPTGAVNMTTADRPTFLITLALPPGGSLASELRVLTEGWASFDTDGKGRGELFSVN